MNITKVKKNMFHMRSIMSYFFIILGFVTLLVVVVNGQTTNFPDCKTGPLASFPICNQSVPTLERAIDIVSRLTLSEKTGRLGNEAYGVARLGLPTYRWWSEALHGVMYWNLQADLPGATSFPIPLNLAATFNMDLVHRIGGIISTEARASNNQNEDGLNFFTPNINIFRDPRWGRGQETPGEDPFLTSSYTYAMVKGLQEGEDKRYLKVAANCKHYVAYDLENSDGVNRFHFDAKVTDQDLVETYLPPFETCIRDSRGASIMCSFNSINGIPLCAHQFLLQTIAR
jgi:beta-D-xylosidase 4